MAIQMRRGEYDDFDASKMLSGELAVVVSGDPETEGGALYVATAAGSATRVAFANEIPGDATTTSDGLMSAADKAKLDGVAAGAQANVIESVSVNGNNATVIGKAAAVTIPEATDAASGVMGAADKAKLDGIAAGANKVTITETTRGSGAKVVSFSVQNPDGTFEFPPTAVKADSNGYVDMTSVANGSIPNSKLATPYSLPTMSTSVKGGATVGDGLSMTGDALGIADEGVDMGMLSQDVQEAIAEGGSGAKLSAASESILGTPDTAQWATRVSTGNGAATVRSVQGAAVGWNQTTPTINNDNWYKNAGVTATFGSGTVRMTYVNDGTTTASSNRVEVRPEFYAGHGVYQHKYLILADITPSKDMQAQLFLFGQTEQGQGSGRTVLGVKRNVDANVTIRLADIVTETNSDVYEVLMGVGMCGSESRPVLAGDYADVSNAMLFDLTQMFGAGNEPTTVAEFERMYPEAYYPYSAPTLKPVQIAGIKSVGFNQWGGTFKSGNQHFGYATGEFDSTGGWVCTDKIPAFPDTVYYVRADLASGSASNIVVGCWDAGDNYLGYVKYGSWNSTANATKPNTAYIRAEWTRAESVTNICINISDPARNGQYKPYTTDSVEWPAQTLRAAGSVADMLYSDHVDVRVGVVDFTDHSDTTFTANDTPNASGLYNHTVQFTNASWGAAGFGDCDFSGNVQQIASTIGVSDHPTSFNSAVSAGLCVNASPHRMYVRWTSPLTEEQAWSLIGDAIYAPLTTPTTQPITNALPMTYKVQAGGSESIIVPAGEVSAAPVITVAEGESAADVVMDALACIAAPDGPVATANHAVGTYLTMQGKLYKVTRVIAVGETIAAGTNVSETTVMAELLALTA